MERHIKIGMIIALSVLNWSSCKPKAEKAEKNWAEIYQDSIFLNIEGGHLDELFMEAKVNPTIYYRAAQRMFQGLSIKNDTLYWNIKNGAEVKISENIYDYITFMWKLDNEKLKSDTIYEIRKSVGSNYVVKRKDTPESEYFMKVK